MTTWTETGLQRTWRALANDPGAAWALAPLHLVGRVAFHAGRSFPGSREAVVVDFPAGTIPDALRLPAGGGFEVRRIPGADWETGREAIALVRDLEGAHDLFAMMAVNVLRYVETLHQTGSRIVLDAFLLRVREWQDFMTNRRRKPLSPDRQVGLMGELLMLEQIGAHLQHDALALGCWQGPMKAAQDIHLENGAIEVKSTVRTGSFVARINSTEQLDTERFPMFLVAFRFEASEEGQGLPEVVAALRKRMMTAGVASQCEALLALSGYFDEHADQYGRRLTQMEMRCLPVDDDFPCLRRSTLPTPVRQAVYDMDLDAIETDSMWWDRMLDEFTGETDAAL